jgi:hypothetical protein
MQDDGMIMLLILGSIQERHWALGGLLPQDRHLCFVMGKFLAISALKFNPFSRIVAEPNSEIGAWRHVLKPDIDL